MPSSSTLTCRSPTSSTQIWRLISERHQRAVVRLLGEANRHGNDPELFAGLVHACRYCGLYDQSIAAHAEARRLDPNVPTSIEQTLLMTGDIDRLFNVERTPIDPGGDKGIRVIGLGLAGRRDEARRLLLDMRRTQRIALFESWAAYLTAWLDYRPADMPDLSMLGALKINEDPEAMFQEGWLLCDVGEYQRGLRAPAACGWQGLFRRSDSCRRPGVRRATERSRLPGAVAPGRRQSRAGACRVPRGRGGTTARPVTAGRHDRAWRAPNSEAT